MQMNVHAVANLIYETAQRIVGSRWITIANFFGADVRPHHSFPLSQTPREPYAPGFGPQPDELHVSTFAMVDVNEHVAESATFWADQAAYRIEEQVRATMRPANPKIALKAGDRLQAVMLQGASGPIRVRVTQVGDQFRIDLDLLLRKVPNAECLEGVASRLTPAVLPLIETGLSCTAHREQPLRLLFDSGTLANGLPVTVAVCLGDAAALLRRHVSEIVADIDNADGSTS